MALTDAQKKKIEEKELYRSQIVESINFLKQKHGVPAVLLFFISGKSRMRMMSDDIINNELCSFSLMNQEIPVLK